MRYVGQSWDLRVPIRRRARSTPRPRRRLRRDFDALHERAYGYASPDAPVETVHLAITLSAPRLGRAPRTEDAATDRRRRPRRRAEPPRRLRRRRATARSVPVHRWADLAPGQAFAGPALVDGPDATAYVAPGFTCRVGPMRVLHLTRRRRDARLAIDLRSDTLSPSTPAMFEAMAAARLGMASRGEDEHVLRLEARGADLLGTEAAAFLPNVTSANLLALLAQAPRGTAVAHGPHGARQPGRVVRDHRLGRPRAVAARGRRGHLDPAAVEARLPGPERRPHAVDRRRSCSRTPTTSRAARCITRRRDRGRSPTSRTGTAPRSTSTAPASRTPRPRSARRCATSTQGSTRSRSPDQGPLGAVRRAARRPRATSIERARDDRAPRRLRAASTAPAHFAAAGLVALDTMLDRLPEDHRRARALAEALAARRRPRGRPRDRPDEHRQRPPRGAGRGRLRVRRATRCRGRRPAAVLGGRLRAVTHRGIGDADLAGADRSDRRDARRARCQDVNRGTIMRTGFPVRRSPRALGFAHPVTRVPRGRPRHDTP